VTTSPAVYLAAALALGEGTVVYRRSAGALNALRPSGGMRVEVVSPKRGGSRPGVAVHHCSLDPRDVTDVDGIPVTTPMRTLVDLAGVLEVQGLARALRRADEQEVLDMEPLNRLLATRPRGATKLRALLRDYADGPRQRSDLERMLNRICRSNQLPLPHCNVIHRGHELDFVWPEHKLIAEVDSWIHHRSRHAFNRDRRRDVDLLADESYRTARFTDLQLAYEPQWVAQSLRKLLR
jgi:very-short-patch-repair endonuclease